MKFTVLKSFQGGGQVLNRGDVIDVPASPRTQVLIESRFLLPADPEVEAQTKTETNAAADDLVKRRKKG